MSVKNFAKEMRESIEEIKGNGTAALYCDNIIEYLQTVENAPEPVPTEVDMENYKARLQSAENTRKLQHDSNLEMFRSVITAGQNAMRTSLLLNGGAAVALLAFIGHLATCSSTGTCAGLKPVIHGLSISLSMFALGALCATVLAGLTYLSQWFYAAGDAGNWQNKTGFVLNIGCILLGISSYGIFSYAVFHAVKIFGAF